MPPFAAVKHGPWYRGVLFYRNRRTGRGAQGGPPHPRKSNNGMYDSLTDFMQDLSADSPVLWALLVMAVVVFASLILFAFWEVVLRLISARRPMGKRAAKKNSPRSIE